MQNLTTVRFLTKKCVFARSEYQELINNISSSVQTTIRISFFASIFLLDAHVVLFVSIYYSHPRAETGEVF